MTFPSLSAMVTMVLLNEAWMCAMPWCTTRFSPRFLKVFLAARLAGCFSAAAPSVGSVLAIRYTVFFLAIAPRRGPLRVRALVRVRWPRTGRPRRCRNPR